ncbi:hypothetical protein BGX34_007567 [Mortierella sp. NVP85]|nr:hypothetical protein BGX34_007567 [Mortierella sp. NVP85]
MHRRSNKSLEDSMAQLIRALLQQVHHQDQIPGLLRTVYPSQGHEGEPQLAAEPSVFEYGSFIRKFMLHKRTENPMFATLGEATLHYAVTHQLYEECIAEGLFPNLPDDRRDEGVRCAVRMDLDRKLTWTLCQDHLETIEELAIPSLDIERYIDHAHQFTSLSRVNFTLSNILWLSREVDTYSQGDWIQHLKERDEQRDRLFGAMTAIDTHFDILSHLPPLQNPRSIDSFNWRQLVARLSDTNLSYVESIDRISGVNHDRGGRASKLLSKQPPYLPRCRALKRLATKTLGPDMFQWAVLEKKQRDEGHHQESGVGRHLSERGYHYDLVPLQSIRLVNKAASVLIQEMNDIAFAFSDTLEELAVSDWGTQGRPVWTDLGDTPQVIHGRGWNLPRLRILSLEVNNFQLHFDMDALHRSSALESLCLQDSVMTYNLHDIWSWPSVHLPRLKKLELTGSPALRINLESLHHSPCLEELTLSILLIERGDGAFYFHVPSPQDLESEDSDDHELSGASVNVSHGYQSIGRRPRWTWDWYLPKLSKLHLDAVFAYRFDFQWLQHLPNLQHIRVNSISSGDRLHERCITLKDLSRGKQEQQDEDGDHTVSDRYIRLPKLESIDLDGYWSFDEDVMETLCLIVSPNLRRVNLGYNGGGYTLQKWITLSRKMPCIERLVLNMNPPLTHDRIKEQGLVPPNELKDEQRHKRRIEYVLDWDTYYDVLEL